MKKKTVCTTYFNFAICLFIWSIFRSVSLAQMPKDNRSVMLQVPEAGNPVSNGMLVATIRTAGGTSGKRLVSLLATDNLHIGIAGKQSICE
ncbi:MAG: hypothetical protein ACLR5N_06675 [Haemophilus parainfluenzae]